MANLLEKASIVLTPTGYSVDAIHNVKPSESPFGDMTFIQAGTTTRVNASGLVVDNLTDIPRIDYSNGEGAILSELQSTNQVLHSEDLTQSGWLNGGTFTSSVSAGDPRGNLATVSNIFRYGGTGSGVSQVVSLSSGGKGVGVSAWVYNPSSSTQQVWIGYGNSSSGLGSFISVNSFTWQRIEYKSAGGVNVNEFHIAPAPSSNLRVWGCQFEIGDTYGAVGKVSSYMPTTSGTTTRTRDNYRDGGHTTLIGAQEGVLYMEAATLSNAGSKAIALSASNSAANRVVIFYSSTSNTIQGRVQASTTTTIPINGTVTDNTDFNKIAFKYKSGDLALWINGTEVATSTNAFTFNAALSELAFDQGNGTLHTDGFIKQVAVFKEVLSDAELAALTS